MSANLKHIHHPILEHYVSLIRKRDTGTGDFRRYAEVISQIMVLEATRDAGTEEQLIDTPVGPTTGHLVKDTIVFVPVLRAGLAMLDPALHILPNSSVGFIGLERDEKTAVAREYYKKFPLKLDGQRILILDPMLATGGSLIDTIERLHEKSARNISAVCIVAAPEGIAAVHARFPEVIIFTAAVDQGLNDQKFIVPGLGDFGDRYFGT